MFLLDRIRRIDNIEKKEESMLSKHRIPFLIFLFILFLFIGSAFFNHAIPAKNLWQADNQDEIFQLKQKIIELQNQGDLGFKDFVLCSEIISFASYVPLEENLIPQDGKLLAYFEPANIYTRTNNNTYEIWYTEDMILLDSNGEKVGEWNDILNFHYTTKKPVMDLFAQNTIDLKGLPPGKYTFKAVLKDQLSKKFAVESINFEIR